MGNDISYIECSQRTFHDMISDMESKLDTHQETIGFVEARLTSLENNLGDIQRLLFSQTLALVPLCICILVLVSVLLFLQIRTTKQGPDVVIVKKKKI